jgi:tRNA (guanine37-N1)-methyltransferase
MRIDVVTIFPDYLEPLNLSLVGKARAAGILDVRVHDLRDHAADRHRTVDDTPYGGGAGMVMRPDVWGAALDALAGSDGGPGAGDTAPHLLIPSPSGRVFDQAMAAELAGELVAGGRLAFACGRYEGIDGRVAEDAATRMRVTEVSIGDYVLNGGEVAALVIIEAVARLLPGVVGNPDSLVEESHGIDGLLEYPVYTKPPSWRGRSVPDVLISGHHGNIARWRRDQALRRTVIRRPDLAHRLDPATLDAHDRVVLDELGFRPDDPPVAD